MPQLVWLVFDEQEPIESGQYLVSYGYGSWGVALWNNGEWFREADNHGHYHLQDPTWWCKVEPPKN